MKFAGKSYTQRFLIKKPAKKLKYLCFFSFFLVSILTSQTFALADSQITSADNPIQNFTPPSPSLAKGDVGGFSEKKTLKPSEFVFDIKDGKLWLYAKEADFQEVLKAIGKKAGMEVEIHKEIKDKIIILPTDMFTKT